MSSIRRGSLVAAVAVVLAGCGSAADKTTSSVTTTAASTATATATATAAASVVKPKPHRAPTVRVARTAYGRALTDTRGFALYLFTHDQSPKSTCYGACASAWPPYVVRRRPVSAGRGAHSSLLGSIRRNDGRLQVTYAGHPLYYYVGDKKPGQVLCQAVTEFGGTWYVVAPGGSAIR
jgi:predicted lipoprotein with Yx(FWY)xxD motif